ncbi:MAG: BMP family ABC transporter substrate-binding protein [Bowdeniella nasicola]|nr:BMP family ABC transporter substrate-binding protein [Bowdeniella nasicola]
MKKTALVSTLAAAALVLTACGEAPEEKAGAKHTDFKACMVSDEGGFDDRSFNESGIQGLEKAEAELGVEIAKVESKSAADFEQNIDTLIQQNCDLIIGVGFMLNNAIRDAAQDNPDLEFALIDSRFTDENQELVELENAKPLVFNTAEAAYLAGYLAAGMTESGKVGTYGGGDLPSVKIFMDGFVDGVGKYNEDNGTNVEVLGWDKDSQNGQFVGNFSDKNKGKQLTENLLAQGADIIMPVAGPVGDGTLAAVKSEGKGLVVWPDTDGYESTNEGDIILTSVMKEIGQAVFDVINAAVDGNFSSEASVGTLENGGVSLAPFHDFDDEVPAELKDQIDAITEQIVAGEITVETENQP